MEYIVGRVRDIERIREIQLVTNGTLLGGRAERLKEAGLDLLTVSVDAATDSGYRRIRGTGIAIVKDALRECYEARLPVRLNSVVMRSNMGQVEGLLDMANEYGASLKLLDLIDLDSDPPSEYWEREFVDLRVLDPRFANMASDVGFEEAPGGIGASLRRYILRGGQELVVKQSTRGGFYESGCHTCAYFPCQDALISIRITHNGFIKKCLIRNDNLVDMVGPMLAGRMADASGGFGDIFSVLCRSEFRPGMWWDAVKARKAKDGR